MDLYQQAAELILKSKHTTVFTGAGISVESGIPPFRGETGLWSQYDPIILDLDYYYRHPNESWPAIKKLFYDFFGSAKPNLAHQIIAQWEKKELVHTIITQNIDHLHQNAGSEKVLEFHGSSQSFICAQCYKVYKVASINLDDNPPLCQNCTSLLKPNFIFFGEGINPSIYKESIYNTEIAELYIIIGTTGEVMPASQIPLLAKQRGAQIIEINIEASHFTAEITDIYLEDKASIVLSILDKKINALLTK